MSYKVTDIRFAFSLASNIGTAKTWTLQSVSREMRIRSILFDILAYDTTLPVGNSYLPWERMQDQIFQLVVGQPGDNMAYAFTNIIGGGLVSTGERFIISRPGQYFFNSFFIKNELSFALVVNNKTAINMSYDISIVVETEEKTIFP